MLTGGPKWLARLDFLSLVALFFYFAMSRSEVKPATFNIINSEKAGRALILIGGVLFLSTLAHLFKHWGLETDGYDVGFVNQPLFYPFDSSPMWCALCLNKTYLADHLVLSFYLLAPITSLFKSDELIIFLQYLLVFLPIVILIKNGPLKNRKELWILAALLVLAHRSLRNGLVFDFREDQIAFAGFLLSCIAFYNKKTIWGFVSLFIALASKENMALVSFFVSVPILFDKEIGYTKKERYTYASIISIVSVLWFVFTFIYIMPFFRDGAQTDSVILMRLPGLGSTPLEIVTNSFRNPIPLLSFIFKSIFTISHVKYAVIMLFPFALFSWRAWPWLVPVLPGLGMNLISAVPNQRFMTFHYDFNVLPFLLFAGVYGLSKFPKDIVVKYAWPILLFGLTFAGRSPMLHVVNHFPKMVSNFSHERFLNSIQSDEIVGMSMRSVGQLSHIKNIRVLSFPSSQPTGGENDFEIFLENNEKVRMRSGLSIYEFTHLLLDKKRPWEERLLEIYLEKGEVIANDSRFYFIKVHR